MKRADTPKKINGTLLVVIHCSFLIKCFVRFSRGGVSIRPVQEWIPSLHVCKKGAVVMTSSPLCMKSSSSAVMNESHEVDHVQLWPLDYVSMNAHWFCSSLDYDQSNVCFLWEGMGYSNFHWDIPKALLLLVNLDKMANNPIKSISSFSPERFQPNNSIFLRTFQVLFPKDCRRADVIKANQSICCRTQIHADETWATLVKGFLQRECEAKINQNALYIQSVIVSFFQRTKALITT